MFKYKLLRGIKMGLDYLDEVQKLIKNNELFKDNGKSLVTTDSIGNIKDQIKHYDAIVLNRMSLIVSELIEEYNSKDMMSNMISLFSYGVSAAALVIALNNGPMSIAVCMFILLVIIVAGIYMWYAGKQRDIKKRKYVAIKLAIEELL